MDTIRQIIGRLLSVLKFGDLLPDFSSARGVFCAIAWLSTLLAIGGVIIMLFSGGDADTDTDTDGGHALSVRAVIGFLLGLGWGGLIAVQSGIGTVGSLMIGLCLGLILFCIVAALMRFISGLKSDGTLSHQDLVGCTGTVYVTVPPNGESGGQVQIAHPGQLVTMAAVQYGDAPLPVQSDVEVVASTANRLVVRPLNSADK